MNLFDVYNVYLRTQQASMLADVAQAFESDEGGKLPKPPASRALCQAKRAPRAQKSPDTPGSPEGNTEGPGTASSEPLLPF